MLNDILGPMSRTLLSAHEIAPVAAGRPSPWAERTYRAESRLPLPQPQPGDGASLERHRRALMQQIGACMAENPAACAPLIHALLNAASWADVSGGDPYACDPCCPDDAFADTACCIAAALNMLRERLMRISPALPARMEAEIRRRVLAPLAENAPLNRLSLPGLCRLLCAVILGGTGESLRWPVIRRLCSAIDQHLQALPVDGSLPGGLSVIADTAIALTDMAEVILAATKGRVNLTAHPRLACMADPILFAHLNDGMFVNPGANPMRPALDAESLFRFGRRIRDDVLCDTAAWLMHNCDTSAAPGALTRALNRNTAQALSENAPRIRLFRNGLLPGAGLMFMRNYGLHISMTGGTGTSHADAGSICLMHRQAPILIDLGGDCCETQLHSIPTIDGIGQLPDTPPAATEIASDGEDATCFSVNLTSAYPENCPLSDYQRTLLMGSEKNRCIRLMDMLQLTREAEVDFRFICACEPKAEERCAEIGSVLLTWDADLTSAVAPVPGGYCLTLHAAAALRHNVTFTFR